METTLKVEGMHCPACENRVRQALEDQEGVRKAEVSVERGEARVEHDDEGVPLERLREAVERAGYTATP